MDNRLAKQIIYGFGYLLLLALIIFVVYYASFRPTPSCLDNRQNQGETGVDCGGPCSSCELKNLAPLKISEIKYFPAGSRILIAAEIQNPNLNYGADRFSYSVDALSKDGRVIKSIAGESFVYAGEIKYILEQVEINSNEVGDVKIKITDFSPKPKEQFSEPSLQLRSVKTEESEQKTVEASGFLKNNNAYNLSKVRIIGFLANSAGVRISASKTELENLPPFEEKFFKINFEKGTSLIEPLKPAFSFSRDLTIGSKGQDVEKIQTFLKEKGFFERVTTQYFGQITKNALANYQKSVGISPSAGYFGPKTRAYINNLLSEETIPTPNLDKADPEKTKIYAEALR